MKMRASDSANPGCFEATPVFFIDKSPYAPWAGRLIETEMRRLLVVSRVALSRRGRKNKPNIDAHG
jgi:hypothetical protein